MEDELRLCVKLVHILGLFITSGCAKTVQLNFVEKVGEVCKHIACIGMRIQSE